MKKYDCDIPEYDMTTIFDLSVVGAHLPIIACIAGNVTPWNLMVDKEKSHQSLLGFVCSQEKTKKTKKWYICAK